MENKKYPLGIWTPFAQVLCYECHGYNPMLKSTEEEFKSRSGKFELKEDNVLTTCNNCHREIQIDGEVGTENNLTNKLRELGIDANMYQNGGMCSACSIELDSNEEILIKGCKSEEFMCDKYDDNGEYMGGEYTFYCDSEQEMIDHIKSIKNTCKICIK